MKRLPIFLLSVLAFLALYVMLPHPALAAPNIVFILADDLDTHTFQRAMPRTKALIGAQGATFDNAFVSLSVCCPSRATILRGQYAHNTGVYTNTAPDGGFEKFYRDGLENQTMATLLRNSGYRTAMLGKYLNGYPTASSGDDYIPPGWSHWFSPSGGGAYSQYNYTINNDGRQEFYGNGPEDHMIDVMARDFGSFVDESVTRHPGEPFFVYLAPYLPHGPARAPRDYLGMFMNEEAPRGGSFNEADVSDKPGRINNRPRLDAGDIREIDDFYVRRLQSAAALDDFVAGVVASLARADALDNTILVFTSDNGFRMGQHRLKPGKGGPYEEEIGVPLVMRGPGIPAGTRVAEMSGNVDFLATFLDVANVTPPPWNEGRSLLGLAMGRTPSAWREVFLLEQRGGGTDGPGAHKLSSTNGIREPADPGDKADAADPVEWKRGYDGLRTDLGELYVEYLTGDQCEYYKLALDPAQLVNTCDSMPASRKAYLSGKLRALVNAKGADILRTEQR